MSVSGDWDFRLSGMNNPCSCIKFNGKYYLYYVGSEGKRAGDTGPSWRRLGVMISDDGVNFTKYAGNPIYEYFPTAGGSDEEGIFGAFARVRFGKVEIFFSGVMDMAGVPGAVWSDILKITSNDGLYFPTSSQEWVIRHDHPDTPVDKEQFVCAMSYADDLHYTGKGLTGYFYNHAYYSANDNTHNCCTIAPITGNGSEIKLSNGDRFFGFNFMYEPYTVNGAFKWWNKYKLGFYKDYFSGDMVEVGELSFDNLGVSTLFYDEDIQKWFHYWRFRYADDIGISGDIFVRTLNMNNDRLPTSADAWSADTLIIEDAYDQSDPPDPPPPIEPVECDYFVYNPADGTYPDLGDPSYDFGSESGKPEPFPEVPLRYRNKNFNEEGSTLDSDMIEAQLDNVRLDGGKIIDTIMENEDIADDPNKIDNIFIKFHVRLYDESIAGRQYLYTFFKGLFDYHLETSNADRPTNCKKYIDPGDDPEGPGGDYIIDDSACSSITVYTDFHWYKFGFSTIRNTYYTLIQIAADADLYNIYHSNYKSFDAYGNFKRNFYTSSGALLTPAGFTAENENDIESWLKGGLSGKKSAMKLPPDAPGFYWLKPANRITRYSGLIYDSEGNLLVEETELKPEYVYVRYVIGGNTYPRIVPIVPITTGVEGVSEITYYEVTENGMNAYTVYGAEATIHVQDTETNTGSLVTLLPTDVNKMTVPYFYGILLNDVGQHPATDGFITSLHLGIYVADVTTVELEWWQIAIKIVGFVIALYTAYAGGFLWYQALLYATIMYMSAYYLAKIIFEIASDFGMIGQIIGAIIVLVITRQMAGGGSLLPNVATMSLSDMLLNFTKLLSSAFKVYADLEKEQLLEADLDFEEEKKVLEAEIAIAERELVGNSDTSELIDSLMADTRVAVQPMDPERYFQAQEDFVNIGTSTLDYDSVYEEQFEFRTL